MEQEKIWESIYGKGEQINIAPYMEPFAFLGRVFGNEAPGRRLLEIGCGAGNNLAFARWAFGFEVHGIDHSQTAIEHTKARFARHGIDYGRLEVGSIEKLPWPDDFFDAAIDRGTIDCNDFSTAKRIVADIRRVLKPGGVFYSNFISENHAEFGKGLETGPGDFKDDSYLGMRHYYARRDVLELFRNFEIMRWYWVGRQEMKGNHFTTSSFHVESRKSS